MATIKTFEDLEVWQKARVLSNDIYTKKGTKYIDKNKK